MRSLSPSLSPSSGADPLSPRRTTGLLCDLLWSDPDKDITGWSENDRGVSFTFGPDVVSRFLQKHDMDLICRAHQVVEDGYEFFAKRQLVTLFSAPNYCGASPSPCLCDGPSERRGLTIVLAVQASSTTPAR